jgi:hypothetical protein
LRKANESFQEGVFDQALSELERVYAMDPGNAQAQELEVKILNAQRRKDEAKAVPHQRNIESEEWRKEEQRKELQVVREREVLQNESVATYRSMLKQAWADGQPSPEEKSMLTFVRRSFGVSDDNHAVIEREVQLEVYTEALRSAWKAGIISPDDASTKENLRVLYGVKMDEHLVIESSLMRELQLDGPGRGL